MRDRGGIHTYIHTYIHSFITIYASTLSKVRSTLIRAAYCIATYIYIHTYIYPSRLSQVRSVQGVYPDSAQPRPGTHSCWIKKRFAPAITFQLPMYVPKVHPQASAGSSLSALLMYQVSGLGLVSVSASSWANMLMMLSAPMLPLGGLEEAWQR